MPRKKYTAEFKTKVVLSILQGDKESEPPVQRVVLISLSTRNIRLQERSRQPY